MSTFQDAIYSKAIELFKFFFLHLFLSRQPLSKLFICFAMKFKKFCQSCGVISPSKTVKIEKQKT